MLPGYHVTLTLTFLTVGVGGPPLAFLTGLTDMTLFFISTGALEVPASVAALPGSATWTGGGVLGSWTLVSSVEVETALSGN